MNNGAAPAITKNLFSILEKITPDKVQTQNTALTAFSNFFNSIKFFLTSNYQQAQDSLRETILLSNSEDLTNISAQAFLFMGQVNYLLNQFQESFSMLNNGMELAEKMSDATLKMYGNVLLKDLFKYFSDPREAEATKKINDIEQQSLADYHETLKMPQHALINWNTNFSPKQLLLGIQRSYQHQNTAAATSMVAAPSISVSIPSNVSKSPSPMQATSAPKQANQSPSHPQIKQQHQMQHSPQQAIIAQQAATYQHSPQSNMGKFFSRKFWAT